MPNRLRSLFTRKALVGWFLVLWGVIEKVSTVDFILEQWVRWRPAMTSSYGSNFALLLAGFGWLAWLVWRTPSGPPVVNLPALARQSPNGHTISGHTFKGVKLEGPAMLFLTGTVRIQDNHFESVTFAQIPDTDPFVTGVIELHNCTVTNCVFDQIGFIGKESLLAKLRLGVAVVNLPQGLRVVPEIQR